MKSIQYPPYTNSLAMVVLYIALILMGSGIGTVFTLESIARGRHDHTIGTYYRIRNIHVRVFRKHPRFITFASADELYYYQHVDETTEDQFSFPYADLNGNHHHSRSYLEEVRDSENESIYSSTNEEEDAATSPSIRRHYFHPSYNPAPLIGATDKNDDGENTEHVYLSVSRNQTLYEEFPDFLPPDTFSRIASCLSNHSAISSNPLEDAFSGTTGFATIFSGKSGVRRFLAEKRFNCDGDTDSDTFNPLAAFFKKALDPLATGFVMNVLVADNHNNQHSPKLVVGVHVDNTLDHSIPNSEYLPNTVSVLYLNVPADMKGGHLDIFGIDADNGVYHGDMAASVFPQENKMARFRGDAYHQVRGYTTEQITEKRISLVLEQYRVLPHHEKLLTEYTTVVKNGMTMM